MRVGKFAPRPLSDRPAEPFMTAEEAWLWFARCQMARIEGVRFTADQGDVGRPCDPDDIYRAVLFLRRDQVLGERHIAVLGRFGCRLSPPDPWAGDTSAEAADWSEALDRLTPILRRKGIVA